MRSVLLLDELRDILKLEKYAKRIEGIPMLKRLLSMILCLSMVLSLLPAQAIALETEEPTETLQETEPLEELEPVAEEAEPVVEETVMPSEEAMVPIEETTVPPAVVADTTEETTAPTVPVTEPMQETAAPTEAEYIPVESVVITQAEGITELAVGETLQLTATVLPENATNKTVVWSSSDESVATVDANGVVHIVDEGTVVIFASADTINGCYYLNTDPKRFNLISGKAVMAASDFSLSWPCASAYNISCLYYYKNGGKHSCSYGYTNGIDITGGGDILAAESGTVETVKDSGNSSYGKHVIIKHNNGQKTLYAHLSSYSVSTGTRVSKGQKIGVMGSSGNSSGVHLHFEYSGGDPWNLYYKTVYASQLSYQLNVRSNNNTYNADKTIVNWIDSYYKKSGSNYIYNGGVPEPSPSYAAPTVANLSINKNSFKIGEEFTLTLSSDTTCSFYLSIIDADNGEHIIGENVMTFSFYAASKLLNSLHV